MKHYRNKKVSSRQVAQDIIEALFKRDHICDERWGIDACAVNTVGEDSQAMRQSMMDCITGDLGLERHLRCVFSQGYNTVLRIENYSFSTAV